MRKYLKIMSLIKDLDLKYTKHFQNLIMRKQSSFKTGKRFEQMLYHRRYEGGKEAHGKFSTSLGILIRLIFDKAFLKAILQSLK